MAVNQFSIGTKYEPTFKITPSQTLRVTDPDREIGKKKFLLFQYSSTSKQEMFDIRYSCVFSGTLVQLG